MLSTEPPVIQRPANRRFDTIDLLRGLAILAVILLHIYIRFFFEKVRVMDLLPPWLGHLVFRNGGNGVTVFFAVSGFLITYTSMRRFGSLADMRARVFYPIRFARIGPPLLLLLALLSLLHLFHIEGFVINKAHASLPGALFSALTFTLNRYEAVHMKSYLPACWTVLWSLSIEEMFYLFFPIACLLLLRFRRGTSCFTALLLALIVTGCFARTVWTHGDDLAQENSYFAGISDIALGVLAALVARRLEARTRPVSPRILNTLQATGALLILLFAFYPRWQWIHPFMHFTALSGTDDTLLSFATCLIMIPSVLRNRPGFLWLAPIRWFGRHSYELYLSHEFVVMAGVALFASVRKGHPTGPVALWVLGIVLATGPLGWLLSRFFSEPLNRRLRPSGKVAAPQTVHQLRDQVQT